MLLVYVLLCAPAVLATEAAPQPAVTMQPAVQPSPSVTALDLARAAIALPDAEAVAKIGALLKQIDPALHAGVYAIIPANRPAFSGLIADGLGKGTPEVQAAAIASVARCWPTAAGHLTLVRNLIESPEPRVAKAAMAAVAAIGDDRPVANLIDRLTDGGEIAAQARLALITLTSQDAGLEPAVWEPLLQERDRALAAAIGAARQEFATNDANRIRAALSGLLTVKFSRSAVAETLAPLLSHPDPAIVTLARGGLGNVGGGVAALLLRGGELPPVGAIPVRKVRPPPPPDHTGAYAAVAIACLIGIVAFLLFRTPLKDTKVVRDATRAFTRSMVRSGNARRLQNAKKAAEETGLYKRGAKAAKRLEETGLYKALVQKPATEAVREATRSFRRKKP